MLVKCADCYNHYDDTSELPCNPEGPVFHGHTRVGIAPLEAHVRNTKDANAAILARARRAAGDPVRAV